MVCEGCAAAEVVDYGEHCAFCGRLSPAARTCVRCRPGSPRYVWVTSNYEGLARQLVSKYKFGELRAAAGDLAGLMVVTYYDYAANNGLDYLVVPVPTATSRRRHRGFDHAQLLAAVVAKNLACQMVPALGRLGQRRQLGAKRELRLKQVEGNYYVRLLELIKDKNILLVDDVMTTGATIKAATRTLRQAGARRIDALVFAKRL